MFKYRSSNIGLIFFWLEPSICANTRDLKDSTGSYLKTLCTVYLKYDQNTARSKCVEYGMQLFTIQNLAEETALLAYSDSQWPTGRLWVEGGNSMNGLMVSNYNSIKFMKEYWPITSTYVFFYCEYKSEIIENI